MDLKQLENDYINAIVDRIPYTNSGTAKKMEEVRKIATDFCIEKQDYIQK